jgi:hypothetical protein
MRHVLIFLIVSSCVLASGCDSLLANVQQMDRDGNSKLSAAELAHGFVELADTRIENDVLSELELREAFADIELKRAWDFDEDGDVDSIDFTFVFTDLGGDPQNRFDVWDADEDGLLSNAEISDTLFTKFDLNRDDVLDDGEMESLIVFYGGIDAYDQDQDGELSFNEIGDAILDL